MNVSWRDLANVKEPGDYPFRDGTISVTFAEIAIWKRQPDAQFQLMRKYPLQPHARYVLGKQLDHSSVDGAGDVLIHTSGNGDSWSLARDPISGLRAVRHQPNRQSGGQVSYIELDKFLREDAGAPEHQALRQLMENKARVATILIAYDIHRLNGETYDQLIASIKTLGTWWHHLETIWIVKCSRTPLQILSLLRPRISNDDQLLVIDISDDTAEWLGINEPGNKWLRHNIRADVSGGGQF
jgi:hypothetical protein